MKKYISLLIILIGAAAIQAQKVNVASDPAANLAKYKTYGWVEGVSTSNPIINQMIIETIDQQMAAKGLKRVSTDPEITLAVIVAITSDLHISNPDFGRSAASATATGMPTTQTRAAISKGTLVVDIADAKTKSTVWRGSATQTLKENPTGNFVQDAKTAEKGIKKAVEKMFKKFP
jgi:uncharacterized protein DUF4136